MRSFNIALRLSLEKSGIPVAPTPSHESDRLRHCWARWTPNWHQLDQPLALGDRRGFYFHEDASIDETGELRFYHELESGADAQRREATVEAIEHPQLGEILRVDTEGLDYIIYPADGAEWVVDADQQPGQVSQGDRSIANWELRVLLGDVSPPLPPQDV